MVKLTQAGNVAIPKSIRDALELNIGDYLDIQLTEEGIILRPITITTNFRPINLT